MKEYGLTVLVAATVTYLLTPLVRKFAIWFGAWHEPRARDVHTEPVPEMGGLAIFCGVAAALLVASRMFPLSGVFTGTRVGSGLLLAGGVVVLMGVVDDRWGLGALTKLVGQIGAGAILVWSGAVVGWLPLPGGGTLALTPDQQTALTILIVALTINAVNFIDGLDGLATGIVGIGAAAFYLYYYTLAKRLGLSEQTDPALASAVLAGVCLGFLPHNFHPARIFLGDTGSMLLGLLLAYVPISSLASLDPNTLTTPSAYSGGTVNRFPEILPLLLPATILLIPYVDLLLAVVRRTRAGQSPFNADKKHLHHRLLEIGHSHRTSVLIMYLWATLFAGTVVLLSIIRTKLPVLGIVTVAGFLVLLWLTMPRLRPWARHNGTRLASATVSPSAAARPAGPVPAGAVPAGAVPASAGRASSGPASHQPGRPGAEATGAGHGAPAGYRPAEPYDTAGPAGRSGTLASYGAADSRPAATAGLAGLSGQGRRSAEGWPAGERPEAGRPGGHLAEGQAGRDYLAGEPGGNGYPADEHGGSGYLAGEPGGNGYPADERAGSGYLAGEPGGNGYPADEHGGSGYLATPAAPGPAEPAASTEPGMAWDGPAESRWDAAPEPPSAEPAWDAPAEPGQATPGEPAWDAAPEPGPAGPGEPRWDTPAEAHWAAPAEPQETGPEDAKQPPEQGRPTWPGDHPETEEPLLPWRFG